MSDEPPVAWVVGTFDTKTEELHYLAELLRSTGVKVVTVDIATRNGTVNVDFPADRVAAYHRNGASAVFDTVDRGAATIAMSEALCALVSLHLPVSAIGGMIGVGGSGGTSIIAPAMRLLPIGRPKLLVSTMASGNMAPFVDVVDMTTMYPVTDIAGLNRLSRIILANAAHALAGMLLHAAPSRDAEDKPAIGLSMFGVTTPCVQAARTLLLDSFECQVFHANGPGGRTLESLAAAGMLHAVVDLTTTEIGQHLVGGVCDAGPNRLDAAARFGLPWVGSLGALDMINWGARDSIALQYRSRLLHMHNAQVTLMRSTADELVQAGRRIAEQLNRSHGHVRLLVPLGGLSMIDAPGQPFYDPEANAALFETLEQNFVETDTHLLLMLPHHINDAAFAQVVAYEVQRIAPAGKN